LTLAIEDNLLTAGRDVEGAHRGAFGQPREPRRCHGCEIEFPEILPGSGFGCLSVAETAAVLKLSEETITRD